MIHIPANPSRVTVHPPLRCSYALGLCRLFVRAVREPTPARVHRVHHQRLRHQERYFYGERKFHSTAG